MCNDNKKIKVVLCWHMHQPYYKDGIDGKYRLPWVYLRAIKDYVDMAAYLEKCPEAKAVVNFAPVLLEQLDDYATSLQLLVSEGKKTGDDLLNILAGVDIIPDDVESRKQIISDCQRSHAATMINPYPYFRHIVDMLNGCGKNDLTISYMNEQLFTDLLFWYHYSWLGATVRENNKELEQIIAKGHNFSKDDCMCLLKIISDIVKSIIPRYKALVDNDAIEVSMTPYAHPIIPLLLDFSSMYDAMPTALSPNSHSYPGGYERSCWHMQRGFSVFEKYFNTKPQGVWLSEGAVSRDAINLLDNFDVKWCASGEAVWRHSYEASGISAADLSIKKQLYMASELQNDKCAIFFRDDGLSDLIGFQYKSWNPDDAVANFMHNIQNISKSLGENAGEYIVPVILDGENAWEYYPDNGYKFLTKLYTSLGNSENIEITTFSKYLEQNHERSYLQELKSGSWVYGSFSTWIGEKDKNLAWDMLVNAKKVFDRVMLNGKLSDYQIEAAIEQLAICEGSDWFWWFGSYNPSDSVQDFDNLYRRHLRKLYSILMEESPEMLNTPISIGGGNTENSGTMLRNV